MTSTNHTHILSSTEKADIEAIESILPRISALGKNVLMVKIMDSFEDGYRLNLSIDRGKTPPTEGEEYFQVSVKS